MIIFHFFKKQNKVYSLINLFQKFHEKWNWLITRMYLNSSFLWILISLWLTANENLLFSALKLEHCEEVQYWRLMVSHTIDLMNSNTSKDFLLMSTFSRRWSMITRIRTRTHTPTHYSKVLLLHEIKFCILCGKTSSQNLEEDWRCTECELLELQCKVLTGSDCLGVPNHQNSNI